jgi:hypothetical protein
LVQSGKGKKMGVHHYMKNLKESVNFLSKESEHQDVPKKIKDELIKINEEIQEIFIIQTS